MRESWYGSVYGIERLAAVAQTVILTAGPSVLFDGTFRIPQKGLAIIRWRGGTGPAFEFPRNIETRKGQCPLHGFGLQGDGRPDANDAGELAGCSAHAFNATVLVGRLNDRAKSSARV